MSGAHAYAYNRSDLMRDPGYDFPYRDADLTFGVGQAYFAESDGEYVWIVDSGSTAHAYHLTDDANTMDDEYGTPDSSRNIDFSFATFGLHIEGNTIWGIPSTEAGGTIEARRLSDGERVANRDISLNNTSNKLRGVWSNGVTFFVVDNTNAKILTYRHVRHNPPATGAPSITGTAQVGETLGVDTTGITDTDGVPTDAQAFTYQWKADGTDISGAAAPNYYPTDDDVGKTITVSVSFTDDASYSEGPLTSAASATVAGSETVKVPWSATVTAGRGSEGGGYGYSLLSGSPTGALSRTTFNFEGNQYTVKQAWDSVGAFSFTLDPPLVRRFTVAPSPAIRRHSTNATLIVVPAGTIYRWDGGSPGWTEGDRAAVALMIVQSAATGAPTITGTAEVGQALTADTSAITDANGVPTDAQDFTYQWVRVDGGTDTDITGATAPPLLPHRVRRGQDLQGQGQLRGPGRIRRGAADQRRQRHGCRQRDQERGLVGHVDRGLQGYGGI